MVDTSVHGTLMWISTGVVLPVSVLLVSRPSLKVHRATLHAWLQIVFSVLFYTGIAFAPESAPRPWHEALGKTAAYGGVPLALATAIVLPITHSLWWKALHRWVSRAVVVLVFAQLVTSSWNGVILSSAILYGLLFVYWGVREWRARSVPIRDQLTSSSSSTVLDIEGSGWSWFMTRYVFRPWKRTLSSRAHRGPAPAPTSTSSSSCPERWWKSGTTIRELQHALRQENLTLAGHPSLLDGTLGGWIFTGSHGSGGTLWSPAFGSVVVYDRETQQVKTIPHKSKCFSDSLTVDEQRRYVILEVQVLPVPNVICTRHAYDVDRLECARRFLREDTYLRLIFVNAQEALAYVWMSPTQQPSVTATEDCGAASSSSSSCSSAAAPAPWLASLLPAVHRFPREAWTRDMTLSDANAFAPDPPYWSTAFTYLYTNVELFVHVDRVTPELLLACCHQYRTSFLRGELKGRCEIRCGTNKLFLDFALTFVSEVAPIWKVLDKVLAPQRGGAWVSLHKGKAQITIPKKYVHASRV